MFLKNIEGCYLLENQDHGLIWTQTYNFSILKMINYNKLFLMRPKFDIKIL